MRLRTVKARIASTVGAVALIGAGFAALPATIGAAPPANADTVSCAQLSLGEPCTVHYDDHPGFNTIELPQDLAWVTVMLAGGSGAPDAGLGPAGPGGIIVAVLDVAGVSGFDVWLGEMGHGQIGGKVGWSPAGDGGQWTNGFSGGGGGAASGLVHTGGSQGDPVLVAGGGGGGGGNGSGDYVWVRGAAGGYGGLPPGDGNRGYGQDPGTGGTGGGEAGSLGGNGDGDPDGNPPGSAGGGGGGGYQGGRGGEHGIAGNGPGFNTGGGGGGGSSYAQGGVEVVGSGAAPIGNGWITIIPGQPDVFECDGTSDPRQLTVLPDVIAYSFIAVGGAGSHGDNDNPGGHGGAVTGVLDVTGVETLEYWVGCSGASGDLSGYGYGRGGAGGPGPRFIGNDGGRGGGATAIGLPDGTMLVSAGGGGGTGGDVICDIGSYDECGGMGGSGGGTPDSSLPGDGADGNGGGSGGGMGNNYPDGQPDPNGSAGESGYIDSDGGGGGGGGGGSGWPAGGTGGRSDGYNPGGGGGAGSSFFNQHLVSQGMITTSGTVDTDPTFGDGYLLMIPIYDPSVDVTVRKAVTGGADGYAQGPFTMHVVCTVGADTVMDSTFQLDAGGEHVLEPPQGSDCTLTETGTGGASAPAAPQQFTVGSDPSTITMSNGFAATTVDLTVRSVVLDEGGQPVDDVTLQPGPYGVAVSCTLDGHELALPSPVVNGVVTIDGNATFTADGVTVSIPGLPVGASCAVTEQPDAHATSVSYTADGSPSGAGEPFTLLADGTGVVIDNTYQLAPLSIPKAAGGNGTVPDGVEFAGSVTCIFNGAPVAFGSPRTFAGLTVGGSATVHDLPIGAHCTISETETGGALAVSYAPAATVVIQQQDTQVTITNVYDTGSLIVRASTTGAGAAWVNTDLSLHVVCTDQALTVLDDTFTTPPGGGWKSYAVDEGAVCTVTETVTGGATSVAYASSADGTPSPTPVEVTVGTDPVTLLVDNAFDAAALEVSVSPSGAGVAFADPSTVTVQDCSFNGLPIQIVGGATSIPFGFPAGGGASGVPQLVVGAECVVELTDTGGATSVTHSVDGGAAADGLSAAVTVGQPGTSVAFTTVFDVAGLDVQKVLAGDGAWASNSAFEVEVVCTLDGTPIDQLGPDGRVALRYSPDGTPIDTFGRTALRILPVGASCALEETGSGGASGVEIDQNPAIVDADGTTATVTNTFSTGTLTVTKSVAGNDAASHANDAFTFSLGCTFNGQPIGSPPSDPQPTTFHLVGGASATFLDRPIGADCTVDEVESREATSVSPDVTQTVTISGEGAIGFTNTFDVATLTVSEVLTGPGADTYGQPLTFRAVVDCEFADGSWATLPDDGRVLLNEANGFTQDLLVPVGTTCGAAQSLYFATSQSISPPVDILLGGEHTITITSDYRVGEVTVSKTALGDFDPDQEFGFAITCTWPEGPPPADAPPVPGPVTIPLNGNAPNDFTLRSGEDRTVTVLSWATCTTTEVSAAGALRVDSVATGTDAVSGGTSASLLVLDEVPGEVQVTNFMIGSLPVTGAEWGRIGLVATVLLLSGAAIFILRREHRTSRP